MINSKTCQTILFSFLPTCLSANELATFNVEITPVEGVSFPEWSMIRYPKILTIPSSDIESSTSKVINFKDQYGYSCNDVMALYDRESGSYIFLNCLESKDEKSLPLTYIIRQDGNSLSGVAVMQKVLLRLTGVLSN